MGHVPVIVDMHAEDAAILWVQRDRAVDAPHFNRKFLARLDERLEANLDGLRVAGRAGWETARAAYDRFPEAGEVFTLAALAFGAGSRRGMGEVFDIVAADTDRRLTRAAVSGLGWLEPDALRGLVQPLLDDRRAPVRALGVGACAVHRVDPGPQLARLLADAPIVRHSALKLAGILGRTDLGSLSSVDDDESCQFRAAWAMVRMGDRGEALSTLWRVAGQAGPHQIPAFELAVIATEPEDVGARLRDTGPGAAALAVRAAGLIGRVDAVEWLIDQMWDPAFSRLAGESFAMITGADLAFLDLDAAAPVEEGPNDDPSDPLVERNPDEDLPVPDPAAIAAWWQARADRFTKSPRYILGQPTGPEAYRTAFEVGFQRQRRASALVIGCLAPEQPLLNWRSRQKRLRIEDHAMGYWQAME